MVTVFEGWLEGAAFVASCGAFRAGDLKTPMDFRLPRRRRQSEKEATWLGSSRTNLEVNSSENDPSMGDFEFSCLITRGKTFHTVCLAHGLQQ